MQIFGDFHQEFTSFDQSTIAILPVPYDATSTWLKGADKGPQAILEASPNLEFYDIETDSEAYKKGIFTCPPITEDASPEEMTKAVEKEISHLLNHEKFVVTIGGNHSVSIGAIYAHAKAYEDLTILQLDAHSDLRPTYEGSPYNHACVMNRALEVAPILQVGIRSMDVVEKPFMDRSRVFFAHNIVGKRGWEEEVANQLTKNVYITIDLDVFDPCIMPSTGTPEPGGLSYYEVMNLLKEVNQRANIVGIDVVELLPSEHNKAPDFMAAKLIYQFLSNRFFEN